MEVVDRCFGRVDAFAKATADKWCSHDTGQFDGHGAGSGFHACAFKLVKRGAHESHTVGGRVVIVELRTPVAELWVDRFADGFATDMVFGKLPLVGDGAFKWRPWKLASDSGMVGELVDVAWSRQKPLEWPSALGHFVDAYFVDVGPLTNPQR